MLAILLPRFACFLVCLLPLRLRLGTSLALVVLWTGGPYINFVVVVVEKYCSDLKTNYIFGKRINKRSRKSLFRKILSAILVEINAFRGDAMKTISAIFEVRPFQVIG